MSEDMLRFEDELMTDLRPSEPDLSLQTRTLEEIDFALKDANVEVESLKPIHQSLWFAKNQLLEDNLFLLELDKQLLALLKEGQSFTFRGEKHEPAVMCTDTQTFNLQIAEISNSLAIVPELIWSEDANNPSGERQIENRQVQKVFFEYLEAQPTYPKLNKIRRLLEPSAYKGPEFEENYREEKVEFLSTRDLLKKVQASEAELLEALRNNLVCSIDGHWRSLEHDYHFRVLSDFLCFAEEKRWGLNEIIKEEVINFLEHSHPAQVLNHLIDWYCEKTENCDSEGRSKWSLRQDRVCRFLGEVLLRTAGKFNLKDFLNAWQQSVPEGMKTDLKYLEGIALRDETSNPPYIYFYPEWELPEDVGERFKALFRTKQKWLLDEIRPYIQSLTTDKINANGLLTKHALGSTVKGVRYYSARHGK